MRQTTYVTDEQLWLYFSRFHLDLEVGVSLATGHQQPDGSPGMDGIDPHVMLQWSDDGGHTWSHEHWMSCGRQGRYRFQVYWNRLGKSRKRVWRITMSDPIAWRILNAYVLVQKGIS